MFYALFKILLGIFAFIDFLTITLFVFIISFLPRKLIKPFMPKLFRLFCWSFIRFLGKAPHIHERFNPPLPKQFIVISNHPSGYDLLILNALFSVTPLAQSGVRSWFIVGKIAEATGAVFVKRDDKNSRNSAKDACLQAVSQGHNLLIYPEGGCYGADISPFKSGAFDISFQTKIPIIPVYLLYEAESAYEWGWHDNLLQHLLKLMTAINKHTHCYIFNPISPESFKDAEAYKEYVFGLYKGWQQKFRLVNDEEMKTNPSPPEATEEFALD